MKRRVKCIVKAAIGMTMVYSGEVDQKNEGRCMDYIICSWDCANRWGCEVEVWLYI